MLAANGGDHRGLPLGALANLSAAAVRRLVRANHRRYCALRQAQTDRLGVTIMVFS